MKHVAIDPGETCGWSVWRDGKLVDSGQDPLWHVIDAIGVMSGLVSPGVVKPHEHLATAFQGWDELIVEDWALYPWKLDSMGWDSCRTARGIGALEHIARASGRGMTLQPASIKDDSVRAGAESLFDSPLHENRHANDSIMHGTYFFAHQRPGYVPGKDES